VNNLAVDAAFRGSRPLRGHRFKRVLRRVEFRVGDDRGAQRLSLSSAGHLYKRGGASDRQQASEATEERSLRVAADQLVVNPMWLTGGSIAVSDVEGAVSPDYRVFEPERREVDPRYLHHLLRSQPYRDQYNLFVRANTTFDRRIQQEDLDQLTLWLPTRQEQTRIADFLDDRAARIDQIITSRQQQAKLVKARGGSEAARLISNLGGAGPPLSAVAQIIDTEHKTAPTVSHGGHWIAGTNAIRNGRLVADQLRETDHETHLEWTVRGAPLPGDVLLTREAPVGEVALLSEADPLVAIGQRVVLLKPRGVLLDSAFLRLVLMAGGIRQVIDRASAGSLHPHLNMSDISRLRIPSLDTQGQADLGGRHDRILIEVAARASQLARSITLLREYKQSLITAAVTGGLDVTTAGSGIPG